MVLLLQHDAHAYLDALKPESQGRTGLGTYPDGMVETDGHTGQLLRFLTTWALPTTRSLFTPPITAQKS